LGSGEAVSVRLAIRSEASELQKGKGKTIKVARGDYVEPYYIDK
jgi:hypothetical protein